MEIVICQNCGNILKTRARTCESCNGLVSRFGSTALPSFPQSAQALSVDIKPDPQVLERVLVKRVGQAGGPDPEMVNAFLSRVFNIVGAPQMPIGAFVGNGESGSNGENGGNGQVSGYGPEAGSDFNGPAQNIDNYAKEAVPGENGHGFKGQNNGSNGTSGYAPGLLPSETANSGTVQQAEAYTHSPQFDPVGGVGQGLPPEPIPGTIVDYQPPSAEAKADVVQKEAISGEAPALANAENTSASAQLANQYIAQYQEQRQSGSFEASQTAQADHPGAQPDPIVGENEAVSQAPPTTPVAVPPPAPPSQTEQNETYLRTANADPAPVPTQSTGNLPQPGSPPPVISANQDFFADSPRRRWRQSHRHPVARSNMWRRSRTGCKTKTHSRTGRFLCLGSYFETPC